MTQQQINHEIALFDGWVQLPVSIFFNGVETQTANGPLYQKTDEIFVREIEQLNYHEDWNLAHSAWMVFKKLNHEGPYYRSLKNHLTMLMSEYETPTEFCELFYKAIQWYKNLKTQ